MGYMGFPSVCYISMWLDLCVCVHATFTGLTVSAFIHSCEPHSLDPSRLFVLRTLLSPRKVAFFVPSDTRWLRTTTRCSHLAQEASHPGMLSPWSAVSSAPPELVTRYAFRKQCSAAMHANAVSCPDHGLGSDGMQDADRVRSPVPDRTAEDHSM